MSQHSPGLPSSSVTPRSAILGSAGAHVPSALCADSSVLGAASPQARAGCELGSHSSEHPECQCSQGKALPRLLCPLFFSSYSTQQDSLCMAVVQSLLGWRWFAQGPEGNVSAVCSAQP